ncbi:hypothetical protein IFR05_013591 [Cadophora sp. M221]|nr:hypothetical protein IFR05_013591 [Cadophora sp. M221]
MKSTTFALGALMVSVAIAQPHRQHMAKHHKRNQEIVWVTDYDYVTETAKVTTTIWVSEGFVVPTETPATPSSAASSQTYAANQFFENASKEAKPSSTSTSVYVAPTPESTYVAPAPSSTYVAPTPSPEPEPTSTYVAPAPVVESSTYVAPAVVETPSPAVVYTPEPVAATTAAAPVAASTYSSSSSSGGVCSSGSPCEGDITYYEAGLGACGETNDGSVDKVIALPVGMMGAQSNGNPYCGKTVTIKKGSKTTTATVVDKCMGCKGNSIDLSNAAFLELAEFDVGRTTATWYFN